MVDDSRDTVEVIRRNLSSKGHDVFTAFKVDHALQLLEEHHVDLVITDLKLPGADGMELVRHVCENFKYTEIMMITGYATVTGAVAALKAGAAEFLSKPFTDDEFYSAIDRCFQKLRSRRAVTTIRTEPDPSFGFLGESDVIKTIFKRIRKASATSATVLITGESGTGKELVARAIHKGSYVGKGPFVPVNCGGIPETLLENELFGHEKGAFTGATDSRFGFFQTAEGGTIFLDEIGEISPGMQVKLLRVLQDKKVCKVGSNLAKPVDVRIIAATNKDLYRLMKEESFRQDLFFRLNVISIHLPPLRDRGDDVLLLARHFAARFSEMYNREPPAFSDRFLQTLTSYSWPGNVRELENIIQTEVVMSEENVFDVVDLPPWMRFSAEKKAKIKRTLAEAEAEHIQNVLNSTKGNRTHAAKILSIDRKTLREKIKKYRLESGI